MPSPSGEKEKRPHQLTSLAIHSDTAYGIIKGKPFPQPPGIATLPIRPNAPHPAYRRKRGMARRRSPPRRGGSSDAARTLVTRHARDSGRAMPNAARQEGGRGTTLADLQIVTVGCPNAGLGVVGGKGLRKPLIPCPISAVDARKAPSSPNGHGPFGPPFGRPPRRRPCPDAGQQPRACGEKKREPYPAERRPHPNAGQQPQADDRKKKIKAPLAAPHQRALGRQSFQRMAATRSPKQASPPSQSPQTPGTSTTTMPPNREVVA